MVAEGGSPTTGLGGKTSTVSDASLLFTHSFMHTHTQAHTCTQKYAHMNTKTDPSSKTFAQLYVHVNIHSSVITNDTHTYVHSHIYYTNMHTS